MNELNEFNLLVGKTIMECQCIEHDIELIYAGMRSGDLDENMAEIKDKTLGQLVHDLQELDTSDGNPYFGKEDYKMLFKISGIRNWLAHEAYCGFLYEQGESWQYNFKKSFKKLNDFYERISSLSAQVEKVRLDIMELYGRI